MRTLSVVILASLINSACTSAATLPDKPIPSASPIAVPSPAPLSDEEELLKACDEALEACKVANEVKNKIIGKQSDLILEQEKQLDNLRNENNSFFKSPILWYVLGAITMALGIGIAK